MRTDGRFSSRSRVAVFTTGLLLAIATTSSGAGNSSPWNVTADSLEPARALVPPGLEWCVRRGWNLEVEEPQRVGIPPRVRQATEKFSAQVELADEGKNLRGYVAGLPFPVPDPSDPEVATKIVWNLDDAWQPGRVFVVEGKPEAPGYEYGRRILYVDRESFTVVHAEMYDHSGGLWKVWIPLLSFSGLPGLTSFHEEGSFPHYVALVMVDTRVSHVTRVSLPADPIDGAAWTANGGPAAGTIPRSFDPARIGRTGLN